MAAIACTCGGRHFRFIKSSATPNSPLNNLKCSILQDCFTRFADSVVNCIDYFNW